jgi:hypothetical protein
MRVAVVFIAQKNREKLMNISRAIARGIEAQGHQVDVLDGSRDVNTKLTIYQYLAFGTEAISMFGGKIPEQVAKFLSSAGMVSGKRCFAFVPKAFMGATRALFRLMKAMEKEGMFLKNSEIIQSEVEAEEIGKRLHVEQPSRGL